MNELIIIVELNVLANVRNIFGSCNIVAVLLKLYHSDACATEADILIAGRHDTRHCGQIIPQHLPQHTRAGAVKYAHTRCVEAYGIVNEIGDGLYGLIGPESTHIYFMLELELPLVSCIDCRHAYATLFWLLGLGVGHCETVYLHIGLEIAESPSPA